MENSIKEAIKLLKENGYFVKKFSDYADYTNVIAGIVLMGIVVTIIDVLVKKLESSLIKWK